jgi:hypothetical protein
MCVQTNARALAPQASKSRGDDPGPAGGVEGQ